MPDLKNKICLVTGASRGVGRGIAQELGNARATVYITGRSAQARTTENLDGDIHSTAEIVTRVGGLGIPVLCDHTSDDDVQNLFARIANDHGTLDLLVNNVWGGYENYGPDFEAPFWQQELTVWRRMFDAGVRAHFTSTRLAVPLMIRQGKGLIINISSGDDDKYRGTFIYDIAKTAVDRMVFAMDIELQKHGIAAVGVHPGFTRTERVMREIDSSPQEIAKTESPRYTGRAVAALALDPHVMQKSGKVFKSGELAIEYDFLDIDGTRPPPFTFD